MIEAVSKLRILCGTLPAAAPVGERREMTDKVVQPARRPVPDSVVFDAGGLEQDEARAIRRVGHDARTPRRVAGAGADEIATGGSALRQNNSFGCGMTRFD